MALEVGAVENVSERGLPPTLSGALGADFFDAGRISAVQSISNFVNFCAVTVKTEINVLGTKCVKHNVARKRFQATLSQ